VRALDPTVKRIPTKPLKSVRSGGPFRAYPVRNAPPGGGGLEIVVAVVKVESDESVVPFDELVEPAAK
jgi:hypothetical protein